MPTVVLLRLPTAALTYTARRCSLVLRLRCRLMIATPRRFVGCRKISTHNAVKRRLECLRPNRPLPNGAKCLKQQASKALPGPNARKNCGLSWKRRRRIAKMLCAWGLPGSVLVWQQRLLSPALALLVVLLPPPPARLPNTQRVFRTLRSLKKSVRKNSLRLMLPAAPKIWASLKTRVLLLISRKIA